MAIARVQTAGATTVSVSFASNNTAGNLIVVCVFYATKTSTVTGATDTRGNTYTIAAQNTGGADGVAILYAPNIAAGANAVTVAFSGATAHHVTIFEYSGADTASPSDGANSSSGTSATATPGSVTTTVAHDLGILIVADNGGNPTGDPTGFTRVSNPNHNWYNSVDENLDVGAAGAINPAFTGFTSSNWGCAAAYFKPASGGGGGAANQNFLPLLGVG